MSKLLTEWDTLETIGSKGRAFKQTKDYTTPVKRTVLKYASIVGLTLSIATLIMAVV